MATPPRFQTYAEFWPYYLGEHQSPVCRALHYVGSANGLYCLAMLIWTLNPWFLLAGLVGGYGMAWIGHFFIEKNRLATFTYPLWSFISDYRMFFAFLVGRLGGELERFKASGWRLPSGAPQAG